MSSKIKKQCFYQILLPKEISYLTEQKKIIYKETEKIFSIIEFVEIKYQISNANHFLC